MKDLKELLNQSAQEIAASSKTSPTAAGQVRPADASRDDALIDAINQVFSLFRINYHNQFHAAFGDTQVLNQAKRLWKESLQPYSSQHILNAARKVIEESEYLPTVHKMLTTCEAGLSEYGIPDVRSAYLEAANAPSPKNAQEWSHPIVYVAGKTVGWYAMSHVAENLTFPAYAQAYRELLKKVLNGEEFTVDAPPQLEHRNDRKADAETIRRELQELRDLLAD
ncbi:MAG: replication protein P [Porticoccaceae bacterium]|nr:replication protein P [Porticoccaceae bacterium]